MRVLRGMGADDKCLVLMKHKVHHCREGSVMEAVR